MGGLADALSAWYATNNNQINTIGINAMLALSMYVMLACGQLSLASPAYMAIGAYTSAMLTLHAHWPFPAQLPAGALLGGGCAFLLGLPLLRLRGVYLAICSVGFVAIVQIFFTTWQPGGGGDGISIPAVTATWHIYLVLAVICYVLWRFEGSAFGRRFVAIRQDEEAARSLGIHTAAHKLAAFALSGMLAGLVGVLYARLYFYIEPANFGFDAGLDALTYVVVGGSYTFLGSVLGAALLTALPELLRFLNNYRTVVNGLVLLGVILFLPGGLVDLPAAVWRIVHRLRGHTSATPLSYPTAPDITPPSVDA